MAIKISGNTVIDNNRNLSANTITATTFTGNGASITSAGEFLQILRPVNLSPAQGDTDVQLTPTLKITAFQSTSGATHANTQFQVSYDDTFSNNIIDFYTGANTTLAISSPLLYEVEHYYRARYIDNNGCCSCFSEPTSFTSCLGCNEFVGCALGDSVAGGFYIGTIQPSLGCPQNPCYYLVIAPNSTGCTNCAWGPNGSNPGSLTATDGYFNTYSRMGNSTYPGANWTATRAINGYSDWYMPVGNEATIMNNADLNGCLPLSETLGHVGQMWISQINGRFSEGCYMRICSPQGRGTFGYGSSGQVMGIRAVRRVCF